MNDTTNHVPAEDSGMEPMAGEARGPLMSHMPHASMIATGVASGLAVTAITTTGRNLVSTMSKNPLVMFGLGLAAGYFAHKYRKEIIATVNDAAERSKDFALRQREHIEDLLAETRSEAKDEADAPE